MAQFSGSRQIVVQQRREAFVPSLAAADVLEYRWLKRGEAFENFVRGQMAATAQAQLDKSTFESLSRRTSKC